MSGELLIVDDDADIRKLLVRIFAADFPVLEAASGEEALKLIDAHHPRLMLLDMIMTGMSGLDVLKAAQQKAVAMTTIVVTGLYDMELAKRALELGASEYITKPFDWSRIKDSVRRGMGAVPAAGGEGSGLPWLVAGARAKQRFTAGAEHFDFDG